MSSYKYRPYRYIPYRCRPFRYSNYSYWPYTYSSYKYWPYTDLSYKYWPYTDSSYKYWPYTDLSYKYWPYKYSSYKYWPYKYSSYKYRPYKYWEYNYPYSYYSSYRYRKPRYYFDDTYTELLTKMNMFKTFLDSIPKNRSDFVNDLEIPEGVLRNRVKEDDIVEYLYRSDSLQSVNLNDYGLKNALSTSSLSLSRAMTDSEIDYDRYRRIRNRRFSDPFYDLKTALEAFPPEYLVSVNSFQQKADEIEKAEDRIRARERVLYNKELESKMKQYLDEECTVFGPDDPGLLDLQEAFDSVDLKVLEDLDSLIP